MGSGSPGESQHCGRSGDREEDILVCGEAVPLRGGTMLMVCAGDLRLLPVSPGLAPGGGHVALDEAVGALVAHQ